MRRELKRLKTYLGRVYRDVVRQVAGDVELSIRFAPLLGLTERLLMQERTSKNKLYRWDIQPAAGALPFHEGARRLRLVVRRGSWKMASSIGGRSAA
jgi:hypothetical protein